MDITKFALEKNRLTAVFLFLIIIAGVFSFKSLPRAEDPEFIVRTALVKTQFPGASPERVEQLITEKLERKIQEMPEIDYIASESRTGISIIYVNIQEKYKKMTPIWDDLKDKVDEARSDLPSGITGPYVWDDFGDVFGIVLSITGDGFSYKELHEISKDVRKELLLLPQVAKVDMYGAQQDQIFVEISNARLAKFGFTLAQLMDLLQKENIVLPGGFINIGPEKVIIEPTGTFENIEDIKQTVISVPGSDDVVYLRDIAEIKRGYLDPPSNIMHFNGEPSIGLAISMAKGGNVITLGEDVKKLIRHLYKEYPIGVEFNFVNYQPYFVQDAINSFNNNLMQGVTIVILVMLLSLGLRTGLIIATLLPMSILSSYILMKFFGIQLQRVSIASLIIALGLIVDCAIVMCDHILVRMQAGDDRKRACIEASKELMMPLLTSTLTTSVAFLPIALAKSLVGEYCVSLFQVVSIALLSSWVLAITMIPFLCYCFLRPSGADAGPGPVRPRKIMDLIFGSAAVKFIILAVFFYVCVVFVKIPIGVIIVMLPFVYLRFFKNKKQKTKDSTGQDRFDTPFYRFYKKFLGFVLTHRALAVITVFTIFIIAMWGFGFINQIFFPDSDRAQFYVDYRMPEGTNIETTRKSVAKLEDFLKQQDEIVNFATYIGEGGPRFYLSHSPEQSAENYAFILINGQDLQKVRELVPRVREFLAKNSPEAEPTVDFLESGAPVGAPIQIRISGKDKDQLYALSEKLKDIISTVPGTSNLRNDWGTKTKKLLIDINQAKAKRLSISSQDIANSLQNQLSGTTATDFREEDELIPVVIRSPESYTKEVGQLESMNVYSYSSKVSIPLRQIANIQMLWEPGKILRRDRKRTITVKSDVIGRYPSEVLKEIKPKIDKFASDWPFGYSFAYGGEKEESAQAQKSIMDQFPIAIFIIIILMIGQFNSFRKMGIIMITIPMGLIGVTVGLLLTKSDFGFMAMLGVISLAGIVINDAIVLIDRIRIEHEEEKKSYQTAIVDAALSHTRPILLTSITTVGGLLPLALNGGEFWSPMAYTVMFGLIFSTVLTLGLVPVLYSLFFRVKFGKTQA